MTSLKALSLRDVWKETEVNIKIDYTELGCFMFNWEFRNQPFLKGSMDLTKSQIYITYVGIKQPFTSKELQDVTLVTYNSLLQMFDRTLECINEHNSKIQ